MNYICHAVCIFLLNHVRFTSSYDDHFLNAVLCLLLHFARGSHILCFVTQLQVRRFVIMIKL